MLINIAFFEKLFEKHSAKQIIKKFKLEQYDYQLSIFMGETSSGMILA